MPAYVGTTPTRWKNTNWYHLLADTVDELHAMADQIGLKRSWFQVATIPHYDITAYYWERAVEAGAIVLDRAGFVV